LACPITTLNQGKIAFTPRLPEKKTNAMKQVKMGVVNKVCLVFPRIFWPLHLDRFGSLSDLSSESPSKVRGRSYMFINMYHETQLPCLAVVLSGQAAISMEEESDNDIVYGIMDRLCLMFPNEHPLPYPIESVITRWSKDTYSGGSSCYLKQNGIPGSFDELLMDSRRLYMAGDHASNIRPGTIEGISI
jgi:monoamine oxidase